MSVNSIVCNTWFSLKSQSLYIYFLNTNLKKSARFFTTAVCVFALQDISAILLHVGYFYSHYAFAQMVFLCTTHISYKRSSSLTYSGKVSAWSVAVLWWMLQLCSSLGLLEVKDGGCLIESHLLWLWGPWRGEWWLKWASNWIGCRGNLVKVLGWLAPLPTTPPQASCYPDAEIMHNSAVMVETYLPFTVYGCVWYSWKREERLLALSERHANTSTQAIVSKSELWRLRLKLFESS